MRRDRDDAGRPRSARPRDAAGRPLPYTAPGVAPVPDVVLPAGQALAEAERLLCAGRPFAAHEVLEAVWKTTTGPERDLWQGLAQLAVGLTHVQRGNAIGAARLFQRSAERLTGYPVPWLVALASQWAEWIDRDGAAALPAVEAAGRAGLRLGRGNGPGADDRA